MLRVRVAGERWHSKFNKHRCVVRVLVRIRVRVRVRVRARVGFRVMVR